MLLDLLDPKVDKVQPDNKDLVEILEYKYSFWYLFLKVNAFNYRVKQVYRAQKDKKEYKELKYCSPLTLCTW